MKLNVLGKTGLEVSAIGLGTWPFGGDSYGPFSPKMAKVMFSWSLGAGNRVVDMADIFGLGEVERLLGSVTNCRKDIVLVTKGGANFYNRAVPPQVAAELRAYAGLELADFAPDAPLPLPHSDNFSAEYLRFAIEQSRQRLATETIPVYLLNNPSLEVLRRGEVFDTLAQFQAEGLIRHFGVSIHEPEEGVAAIESGRVSVVELTFNLLTRDSARYDLLDLAQRHNVGVIVREPLANGLLTGKFEGNEEFGEDDIRGHFPPLYFYERARLAQRFRFLANAERSLTQAALLFAGHHPAVSTVVVGCKSKAQVEENFAAVDAPPLSPSELAEIAEVPLVV